MGKNRILGSILPLFIVLLLALTACEDDRELPVNPPASSPSETILLLDSAKAEGQELRFELLDNVKDGFISVACFLEPDEDILQFESLGEEMQALTSTNEDFEIQIINIELQDTVSHADSLLIDSLRAVQAENLLGIASREMMRDSLDTYLDDRFSLSIRMDDGEEVYPSAVFLDSSSYSYLGDHVVLWGQGFYLAPYDSGSGSRGMMMRLDLDEFMVADGGWDLSGPYIHSEKPVRGSVYPNMYPIRDYIGLLGEGGSHSFYLNFAGSGTVTKVIATLYVVYENAVQR